MVNEIKQIKLLTQVRNKIRVKHYSLATEKTYLSWIKRYILFHDKKHPAKMGKYEIEAFLTHLAINLHVAPTTQNQAFNAILFLYKQVLDISLDDHNINSLRAKRKEHLPIVLSIDEVLEIINNCSGIYKLLLSLMYGCGLRMSEVLNLRIKDIDFAYKNVYIFDSKSTKDRIVPLPNKLIDELLLHIKTRTKLHSKDIADGFGFVNLPYALQRKYPHANKELKWQYIFCMNKISKDPQSNNHIRFHVLEQTFGRNIKAATSNALINKHVTAHTFRHSYATHLLQNNYDIRTIQELLGHKDISTTMIYTHIVKDLNKKTACSPLDF